MSCSSRSASSPARSSAAGSGYLIVHSSYYGSTPAQLLDPAMGGLELGLAVVGGFVTGAYVASLLGASVGRWLHVAAAPLLFALGAGKLAMVLTGAGRACRAMPSGRRPISARALGLPGAGPALGPVTGPRGDRDARHPGVPDAGTDGWRVRCAVTAGCSSSGSAVGIARATVSTTWRDPTVVAGPQRQPR